MSERRDKPRRVYVQEPSRVGEVGLATRLRWVGVIVAVVVIALTMSRYAAVSGSDALTEQDDPEEVGVGPESGQVGRASFGSENSDSSVVVPVDCMVERDMQVPTLMDRADIAGFLHRCPGLTFPPSWIASIEAQGGEVSDDGSVLWHEGPAFSCAGELTATEEEVCETPLLWVLDHRVSSAYTLARRSGADRAALLGSQRAWLASRDACTGLPCLERAYRERLDELNGSDLVPPEENPQGSSDLPATHSQSAVQGSNAAWPAPSERNPPPAGATRDTLKRAWKPNEVDEPAAYLSGPPPAYPESMRSVGIEGVVRLRFVVGVNGQVEANTIQVVSASNKAFEANAIDGIKKITFKPARLKGQPVRQLVEQNLRFSLN